MSVTVCTSLFNLSANCDSLAFGKIRRCCGEGQMPSAELHTAKTPGEPLGGGVVSPFSCLNHGPLLYPGVFILANPCHRVTGCLRHMYCSLIVLCIELPVFLLSFPIFSGPSVREQALGLGAQVTWESPRKQANCLLPEDTMALELDFM